MSKCCSSTANKYYMKIGSVNKLVTNVDNKSRYVLHYRHFQLYLKSEMKLTKVHRIVKLKLSNWLKKRIDFNENRRKDAVISFEKYFFKLMINSIYGKTMENLRKRINVRLVNNAKDCKKYVSKPSFFSQKIFNKHLVATH